MFLGQIVDRFWPGCLTHFLFFLRQGYVLHFRLQNFGPEKKSFLARIHNLDKIWHKKTGAETVEK